MNDKKQHHVQVNNYNNRTQTTKIITKHNKRGVTTISNDKPQNNKYESINTQHQGNKLKH
eukprot:m.297572 g.297572  ORF g.297572 m.297572 type:complete len:60 (+) comp272665_c0_seq1:39-218(+)